MRIGCDEAVVTIVIPCLDEEAAIGDVVRGLSSQGVDEAIVVDGGSRDSTVEAAKSAGAKVVIETRRGYGRACAAGVAAARPDSSVLAFIDGDGSDDPALAPAVIGPVLKGEVDFCLGTRRKGPREPGALTPPQVAASALAGFLIRAVYGARFTDLSPFRAIRRDSLAGLGMAEPTYAWNLEMQMRVAASGLRTLEVPVGCRRRAGGASKVSGNLRASIAAAWTLTLAFVRLAAQLRAASLS